MTCPSEVHGTRWARYRHRCTCPTSRADALRHAAALRVPSRHIHRKGPATGHIDLIAVRICLDDRLVPLTPAELHQAIDRLDQQNLPAREIALRLGISDRTVTRRRARRRQTERTAP